MNPEVGATSVNLLLASNAYGLAVLVDVMDTNSLVVCPVDELVLVCTIVATAPLTKVKSCGNVTSYDCRCEKLRYSYGNILRPPITSSKTLKSYLVESFF